MLSGRVSRVREKPAAHYKGLRIKADRQLHDELAQRVLANVPPPARVLDYGAGEGALSERLTDLGYEVLATDIDEEGYRASAAFEQLDFNDASAVEVFGAAHEEEFDIVLGIEVVEHIENPWRYVRDLRRLARTGGVIVISTPNVTSWLSRISFLRTGRLYQFLDYDREYGHINPVAADELRLILERSGFEVRSIDPAGWLPRLWLSRAPMGITINLAGFVLSFLMRGIRDGWCIIAVAEKR